MNLLAAFLGIDPGVLQLVTALLGFVTVLISATATVIGILNRRTRLRTEATANSTLVALQALITHLAEQRQDHDDLWTAYLRKDTVANPDGVARIARETATAVTEAALQPMQAFYAAVEIVEHRREHRPETDVIRILQELNA